MMVAMWMTRKYLIRSTKVDERTQISYYDDLTNPTPTCVVLEELSVVASIVQFWHLRFHRRNFLHGSNCPFRHDGAVMIANLPLTVFICIDERITALNCWAILEGELVNTWIMEWWRRTEFWCELKYEQQFNKKKSMTMGYCQILNTQNVPHLLHSTHQRLEPS